MPKPASTDPIIDVTMVSWPTVARAKPSVITVPSTVPNTTITVGKSLRKKSEVMVTISTKAMIDTGPSD